MWSGAELNIVHTTIHLCRVFLEVLNFFFVRLSLVVVTSEVPSGTSGPQPSPAISRSSVHREKSDLVCASYDKHTLSPRQPNGLNGYLLTTERSSKKEGRSPRDGWLWRLWNGHSVDSSLDQLMLHRLKDRYLIEVLGFQTDSWTKKRNVDLYSLP